MLGMFTLIASAFCVLYLNPSVAGVGSHKLGASGEPLLDGFRAIYGDDLAILLAAVAVIGLVASFHAIIFAFGRQIYSVSRAGYFPRGLSVTHGTRKTPHIAMIVGSLIGLAVMLAVWYIEGAEQGAKVIGGTLLNMAVFGAMFSYVMQGLSYIQLKPQVPEHRAALQEPARHLRGGADGHHRAGDDLHAASGPDLRRGVLCVAAWFAVGIIYFALVGRHKLILSPEEEFAMSQGRSGLQECLGARHWLRGGAREGAPFFCLVAMMREEQAFHLLGGQQIDGGNDGKRQKHAGRQRHEAEPGADRRERQD